MAPRPLPRPKFALWRYERGLTLRATADLLAAAAGRRVCSHETIRTVCLPFGDPRRSAPDVDLLTWIAVVTDGRVTPLDFEPQLTECAA